MIRSTSSPWVRLRPLVMLLIAGVILTVDFGGPTLARQNQRPVGGEISVIPVQGAVYMLTGGGSNTAVLAGPDGAVVVDPGSEPMANAVLAAIEDLLREVNSSTQPFQICVGCPQLTNKGNTPFFNVVTTSPAPSKPIRYIVNSAALPDHVGGNATLSRSGRIFQGGNIDGLLAEDVQTGATIVSHENVLIRLAQLLPNATFYDLPSEVYGGGDRGAFRSYYKFYKFFNNDHIQLYHMPAAITDGDSVVHFRYSDVLVTGDVFVTTHYPMVDLEHGGSLQGVLDALNRILDMAATEENMAPGTLVIPGHGRLSDAADVARYRDVVTIIRDRVQSMIQRGMTLEEIKAARPTLEFDPRWATDYWTADMFVETVYKDLSQRQ
jgi:cyclase